MIGQSAVILRAEQVMTIKEGGCYSIANQETVQHARGNFGHSLDAARKDCIDNGTLIACLRVLARACLLRFVKSCDTADVDRAVQAEERVVALVDPGPARLRDLNGSAGF